MIVVDANILSCFLMQGERTADAHALRDTDAEWVLPAFWHVEFQSILWKYVRFGGMPADQALRLLDHALDMFTVSELAPPPDVVLSDALSWKITAYDAQYTSLAKHLGIRQVTEDVAVRKACPSLAVSLDDFLRGATPANAVREPPPKYRVRRKR